MEADIRGCGGPQEPDPFGRKGCKVGSLAWLLAENEVECPAEPLALEATSLDSSTAAADAEEIEKLVHRRLQQQLSERASLRRRVEVVHRSGREPEEEPCALLLRASWGVPLFFAAEGVRQAAERLSLCCAVGPRTASGLDRIRVDPEQATASLQGAKTALCDPELPLAARAQVATGHAAGLGEACSVLPPPERSRETVWHPQESPNLGRDRFGLSPAALGGGLGPPLGAAGGRSEAGDTQGEPQGACQDPSPTQPVLPQQLQEPQQQPPQQPSQQPSQQQQHAGTAAGRLESKPRPKGASQSAVSVSSNLQSAAGSLLAGHALGAKGRGKKGQPSAPTAVAQGTGERDPDPAALPAGGASASSSSAAPTEPGAAPTAAEPAPPRQQQQQPLAAKAKSSRQKQPSGESQSVVSGVSTSSAVGALLAGHVAGNQQRSKKNSIAAPAPGTGGEAAASPEKRAEQPSGTTGDAASTPGLQRSDSKLSKASRAESVGSTGTTEGKRRPKRPGEAKTVVSGLAANSAVGHLLGGVVSANPKARLRPGGGGRAGAETMSAIG